MMIQMEQYVGKSNTALMGLKSYTRSVCEITKLLLLENQKKELSLWS